MTTRSKRTGHKAQFRGVTRLKDGQYRLRVYVTHPQTGKQHQRERVTYASNVTEAFALKLNLEKELKVELASGGLESKPLNTLGEVATD